MTAPPFRDDLRPLCPEHSDYMKVDERKEWRFACPEPGCRVHWQRDSGYFYLTDEESSFPSNIADWLKPALDAGHGYFYIGSIENGIRVWKCSVRGCENTLTR